MFPNFEWTATIITVSSAGSPNKSKAVVSWSSEIPVGKRVSKLKISGGKYEGKPNQTQTDSLVAWKGVMKLTMPPDFPIL